MKVVDEMKKDQRKLRKLHQHDNVIIFPGIYERLVREGERNLEKGEYEKAVQAFEGAIQLEPTSERFLFSYALALYETKAFKRAKEIALLALNAENGEEMLVMELYLTVLIQLEEYDEVELSVQALIEEGLVPPNMLSKFIYLRDLNRRLSVRYRKEESVEIEEPFTLEDFKEKSLYAQQQYLTSLGGANLKRSVGLLEEIVESTDISSSIITFSLMLLKELDYHETVTIQKYGQTREIIPNEITLPGQDLLSQAVLEEVERRLEKDPSKLQFVDGAIRKFTIHAFPFGWGDYPVDVIASAYIEYIDHLITGEDLQGNSLHAFIQKVDQETDF